MYLAKNMEDNKSMPLSACKGKKKKVNGVNWRLEQQTSQQLSIPGLKTEGLEIPSSLIGLGETTCFGLTVWLE